MRFNCPNCDALYELERVDAPPVTVDREIVCLSCGSLLQGREDRFVLKYFLLEPSLSARMRRVA